MSIIARLYDSRPQARSAHEALLAAGVPRRFTEIVESPDDSEVGTMALIGASAKAGQLLGEYANFYLSRMQPGQSLVVVDTELGMSVTAINILESHGALDITHETPAMKEAYIPLSEKAAPLSSLLGWSVLSRKSGSQLTSSFGMPLLSNSGSQRSTFGLPLLSRRRWFY